eukprot:13043771-Alexandrium_andersonii.AAC.1
MTLSLRSFFAGVLSCLPTCATCCVAMERASTAETRTRFTSDQVPESLRRRAGIAAGPEARAARLIVGGGWAGPPRRH